MFRWNDDRGRGAGGKDTNAGSALAGRVWLLPIANYRQTMPASCGIAACCQVIKYRSGKIVSDRELAQRHGLDGLTGTSYDDIERVLQREIGARCRRIKRATRQTLADALQAGHPVIAGVAVRKGAHAIVIAGIALLDNGGARLVVNDPTFGESFLVLAGTIDGALQEALVVGV